MPSLLTQLPRAYNHRPLAPPPPTGRDGAGGVPHGAEVPGALLRQLAVSHASGDPSVPGLHSDELPDWKLVINSNGTTNCDDVPILDTPPSATSPISSPSNNASSCIESPIPVRSSAMCLEELYTITEDTENLHI
ncbi:hypothetical protein PF004_g32751 [Phytophthora fragariae]|uniref:Uncharacterized protein n=1 Tax=Phytophthora fragariae TaxID=53985 RepID=A0A6G0M603_9STRA|nr:hypothetical protein PF003_g36134 [Phytophthora fragariae]KAE9155117.1 hypothetical protein PF004_g32751 [Phytophthora fragariae]